MMDRKQKEALVLALAEKGKTYREITKEAGVSPNTIKAVLNKAGLDQTASISSRAFEFYVQQKTPIEVAIALNLEAKEAIRFHQEYIMLLGLTEFTKVYIQIKDNPWPYVNFVKLVQNSGMGDGEVAELLKIANGHLPRVRLEYDRVQAELNSLQAKKRDSFHQHQRQCDKISNLHKEIDCLQLVVEKLRQEETTLNHQKESTENFVKILRNNNETCVRLKQIVKQEIENNILQQPRHLLRIAIASIFESQRKNPEKLRALYYNTPPSLSVEQLLSESSISENQSDSIQFAHSNNSLENLILDEAEQCYNRLVDAYGGKCINEIPNDAESSSLYEVPYISYISDNVYSDHEKPNIEEDLTTLQGNGAGNDFLEIKQDGLSSVLGDNHKILDTGELSYLTFHNKEFQVYPEPKEKSSGSSIWPRDE